MSELPSQDWFDAHYRNCVLRARGLSGEDHNVHEIERDNFATAGIATAFCEGYTSEQLEEANLKSIIYALRANEAALAVLACACGELDNGLIQSALSQAKPILAAFPDPARSSTVEHRNLTPVAGGSNPPAPTTPIEEGNG